MRTRTTAATIALLLAALTGCSSGSSSDKPAAPAPTVTVTATPTLSAAEQRQACVEAWADSISARPGDFDPETDSDTKPPECETIPDADYLDVYMDGLMLSNKRNREALGG
jgi:hypothetical protein